MCPRRERDNSFGSLGAVIWEALPLEEAGQPLWLFRVVLGGRFATEAEGNYTAHSGSFGGKVLFAVGDGQLFSLIFDCFRGRCCPPRKRYNYIGSFRILFWPRRERDN